MKKRPLSSRTSVPAPPPKNVVSLTDLALHRQRWLLACDGRQHSPQTISLRTFLLDKLSWFLETHGHVRCGPDELLEFFSYIRNGHTQEGGRWGTATLTQPVRPRTVHTYFGHLQTFFRWLVKKKLLEESPMDLLDAPVSRSDQPQPFTDAQVAALLAATRHSDHPQRDYAIVMLLLDTGVRASELCHLRQKDLDLDNYRCTVLGKGNKQRAIFFAKRTRRALYLYLRNAIQDPEAPLFASERGRAAGEALTRWGLAQIIERLGKAAKVESCRCSPHTFRHTFAISMLRNGAHVFAVKEMLGHTDLKMTNRYVQLAQADIANQHRQFSPCDRLKAGD